MENSFAEMDLFTGNVGLGNNEMLFQYDEVGTGSPVESIAWNPDDASPWQEESLFADTLVDTNACDSDSAQPIGKVRAREATCGTEPPQIDTEPKSFWLLWQEDIKRPDLMSLEEFTCNNQGYQYVVCDSGIPEDQEPISMGLYSLSYCDLCKFGVYLLFSPSLFFIVWLGIQLGWKAQRRN